MFLTALMFCSLLVTIQTSSESDDDGGMSSLLGAVGGIIPSEAEVNSDEVSKEIKKYHKYITNVEGKYYKDMFSKHISQEEKDQVKYFQELLSQLKSMNRDE